MSQFLVVLTGLAVVVGIAYAIWRPQWAVVAILVMFPLEQVLQGYFPILTSHSTLVNGGVGLLALFAITMRFLRGDRLFSGVMNPATIGVLGLWVLAWIGLLWTPGERALEMLTFGVPYVLLLLVGTQLLIDDLADFHRLAIGFMVVGSIIAALVMLNPATAFEGGRMTVDIGLYSGERSSNPLALATMGGLMAVIAALIQFDRPRPFHLILRLTAFAMGLGIAIQSGSRGQVIAAVVVGVTFYPLARRVASIGQFFLSAVGYGFLFLLLYAVFNLFVGDWNRKRWDFNTAIDVSGSRLEIAVDLLTAFAREPSMWLFGLGPMAFQDATGSSLGYVHNQPVEVLCELGLVGALFFGMAAWTVAISGLWLWRTYGNDPVKRGVGAMLCGLVAYSLIISMKQGSITASGPTSLMWWLVLARIAAHERLVAAEASIQASAADTEGGYAEEEYVEAGAFGEYGYGDYGDYGEDGGHAVAP